MRNPSVQRVAELEMRGAGVVVDAQGNRKRAGRCFVKAEDFIVGKLLVGNRRQQNAGGSCLLGMLGEGDHVARAQRADTDDDRNTRAMLDRQLGNALAFGQR